MPNTIEENIERLKAVVPAIKNSIITKGGTVNSGDGLEEFADDVLSIKNELTDIAITSNGEYYSGEETTLTTTTFPVTVLDAVGTPLKHVDVIGNANQSGTPTPDNPIMPQGTGDNTRNLFPLDENKLHVGRIENNGTIDYEIGTITVGTDNVTYEANATCRGFYTDLIQVNENEKLTFSPNDSADIAWSCNCYDENGNFLGKAPAQSTATIRTFTLLTGTKTVRMSVTSSSTVYTISQPMLNTGSTALPYEPYGIKIPISSSSVTTPIYLGEVETVRYVKKLVLDGTEDFQSISSGNNKYFRLSVEDFGGIHIDTTYCTHFESVSITSSTTNVGVGVIHSSVLNKDALGIRPLQVSTTSLEDFTTYLTQQYNNGTPVTVWYVLATPTTGIVNEPLMKIDGYADQLSIDTNIPLEQNAKNIINIDTTLKPSSTSFTYNKKGDYIGYNKITVAVSDVVDGRIFIITTIPNAMVTISNVSNTYTQTADNTGEAVFENISAGSYTITATYDDAVSDTTTITVTEHSIVEDTFATLTISASDNTTITVTNGTITKTITYTGTPIVQYVSLGTWDLSCDIDGITVTRTVSVDTYTNQDILLEPIPQTVSRYVNFTSNTTTITGDPDTHPVYMGINRCNVSDDGTINAYYGDVSYAEDGSNGQVMVKIPKFYYKVTPDSDGGLDGVNIRKCTWEISDIPQTGFSLHPAFYDANGNEIDYFLYGAFDGVGQNAEGTYDTSYNKSSDKLSSVAGSSYVPSNSMTRATARTMAANRGTGWYQAAVKQTMAVQMLFAVEYGFNSQVAVGKGVTNASAAVYAGQTTGNITSGTQSNETTPVNWRGIENFWGNIFDWIDGLNINERVPYVCDNYTFVDNTSTGYTQISFSLPVSNYITALGYDSDNDWVMLPSESTSTSNPNGPIGDYVFSNAGWRVALLGGRWAYRSLAGAFYWDCSATSSGVIASVGARLMYVPSAV